jgi:hypothetical protein
MVPTAIAMLLYTIGIPAVFAFIVFYNRRKIWKGDIDFGDKYAATHAVYRRQWYFWELFVFLRKFGMIIAKMLGDPILQCMLGIVVLFGAIQLQVRTTVN